MLSDGNSKFHSPHCDQIDMDFISPSQSQLDMDAIPYVDSPFASDFGSDNNGLNFLDGTNEQDVSLTDVLDAVFNNHEELTSHKNSANGSNTRSSGQIGMSRNISSGNSRLNSPCIDMHTESSQVFVNSDYLIYIVSVFHFSGIACMLPSVHVFNPLLFSWYTLSGIADAWSV